MIKVVNRIIGAILANLPQKIPVHIILFRLKGLMVALEKRLVLYPFRMVKMYMEML